MQGHRETADRERKREMKNAIFTVILFTLSMGVAVLLNDKINGIDEAVFQYMKEEHNARVGTDE